MTTRTLLRQDVQPATGGRPPLLALDAAGSSIKGPRAGNKDAGCAGPRVLAVADGVGGKAAGDVASSLAISQLARSFRRADATATDAALVSAVGAANECIRDAAAICPEWEGMATTLTAAALTDDGRLEVAHIGDSRAYLMRDERITQLTTDHTFVQELVDAGVITADRARAHPMRSIVLSTLHGAADDLAHVDVTSYPVQRGDRLLLCSDGLSGVVHANTIRRILTEEHRPADAVTRLVRAALAAGTKDDVTVVVADTTVAGVAPPAVPVLVGAVAGGRLPTWQAAG